MKQRTSVLQFAFHPYFLLFRSWSLLPVLRSCFNNILPFFFRAFFASSQSYLSFQVPLRPSDHVERCTTFYLRVHRRRMAMLLTHHNSSSRITRGITALQALQKEPLHYVSNSANHADTSRQAYRISHLSFVPCLFPSFIFSSDYIKKRLEVHPQLVSAVRRSQCYRGNVTGFVAPVFSQISNFFFKRVPEHLLFVLTCNECFVRTSYDN